MRRRLALVIVSAAILAAVLAAAACLAGRGDSDGAPRPISEFPSDRILTFTIYLGGGYARAMAPLVRKFDYVIVNKTTLDAGMADDARADAPVVLHEGLQIRPNFCRGRCEYEDWSTIDAHEDWFWHDDLGRRVQARGIDLWYMDYRNPEYVAYLGERFRRLLRRYPALDGVFLDQNGFYEGFLRYAVPAMSPAAIHPLPARREYEGANVAALHAIKQALPSSHVVINSNNEALFNVAVDGSMAEGFIHDRGEGDDAFRPEGAWRREIATLAGAGNAGKIVLVLAKAKSREPDDARRILRYALASYLLGRRGDSKTFFGFETGNALLPPHYEEYETVTGEPHGELARDRSGVWIREYENGIAVVHADNTRGSATLALSRRLAGTYSDWDGVCHTDSVTLAPNTGDFLQRSECQ